MKTLADEINKCFCDEFVLHIEQPPVASAQNLLNQFHRLLSYTKGLEYALDSFVDSLMGKRDRTVERFRCDQCGVGVPSAPLPGQKEWPCVVCGGTFRQET